MFRIESTPAQIAAIMDAEETTLDSRRIRIEEEFARRVPENCGLGRFGEDLGGFTLKRAISVDLGPRRLISGHRFAYGLAPGLVVVFPYAARRVKWLPQNL